MAIPCQEDHASQQGQDIPCGHEARQEDLWKTDLNCTKQTVSPMDQDPKTRRESKKSAKEKAKGKDTCYSAKHVRQLEALKDKKK
jgi:hypothetical protein